MCFLPVLGPMRKTGKGGLLGETDSIRPHPTPAVLKFGMVKCTQRPLARQGVDGMSAELELPVHATSGKRSVLTPLSCLYPSTHWT